MLSCPSCFDCALAIMSLCCWRRLISCGMGTCKQSPTRRTLCCRSALCCSNSCTIMTSRLWCTGGQPALLGWHGLSCAAGFDMASLVHADSLACVYLNFMCSVRSGNWADVLGSRKAQAVSDAW